MNSVNHQQVPQKVIDQSGLLLESVIFRIKSQHRSVQVDRLHFAPGECIGIIGPNGSGKSTFFRGLSGLLPKRKGRICWNGREISDIERLRLMHVVMQDCDFQLFTSTVEEEIRFGIPRGPECEKRAMQILSLLALDKLDQQHPANLSGGQKQRLVIASAWMKQPAVMLLDEPTSGMDGDQMRKLALLIQSLCEQGTLCMVISHDREFLNLLRARLLIFQNGKIAENEVY